MAWIWEVLVRDALDLGELVTDGLRREVAPGLRVPHLFKRHNLLHEGILIKGLFRFMQHDRLAKNGCHNDVNDYGQAQLAVG